jgi:hypothetical protein
MKDHKITSSKRKVVRLLLAEKIAEALFVNGQGERAERLMLVKGGRDLGGWGYEPAIDQITKVILGE